MTHMSNTTLYVGMDESNHGKPNSPIGEIIIASYSYDKEFWDYKKHPNTKLFSRIRECCDMGVNYIYTIVPQDIATKNYSNLPEVAPFLIKEIMSDTDSEIKLGLDGRLRPDHRRHLITLFMQDNINLKVEGFIKKHGVHYGPELIYLSHLISNCIFHELMLPKKEPDEHYIPFKYYS